MNTELAELLADAFIALQIADEVEKRVARLRRNGLTPDPRLSRVAELLSSQESSRPSCQDVPQRPTTDQQSARLGLRDNGVDDEPMTKRHALLTRQEAAEYAGISVATLDRRIRSGHLAAIRTSARGVAVDPFDLDHMMETIR